MLIALMPDQVSKWWELIRYSIYKSIPPIAQDMPNPNKLLESAISGNLQVWAGVRESDKKIVAILTTTIADDYCSDSKTLLVYTLFGTGIDKSTWTDGLETLRKYARGRGCHQIAAYTMVDDIRLLVKGLGGRADYTYVTLEVGNEAANS